MDRLLTEYAVSLSTTEFLKELKRMLDEEKLELLERIALQGILKRVARKLNVPTPTLRQKYYIEDKLDIFGSNEKDFTKTTAFLDFFGKDLSIIHTNLKNTKQAFDLPDEEAEHLVYDREYMMNAMKDNSILYITNVIAIMFFLGEYGKSLTAKKCTVLVAAKTFPLLIDKEDVKKVFYMEEANQASLVCATPFIEHFLAHLNTQEEKSFPVLLLLQLLNAVSESGYELDDDKFKSYLLGNTYH